MSDFIKELGALAGATRFRRISEKLYADGDRIYQNADIKFKASWFPVYYYLSLDDKKASMTEIADNIGFSHVTVKYVLQELQKEGLVRVMANPWDGRSKLAHLSPKGKNLLNELQPLWIRFSEVLKSVLDEGHPGIISILDTIDQALENRPISERIQDLK